jgi:hypothetical protein
MHESCFVLVRVPLYTLGVYPINGVESCIVVVVRGNSKFKDLNGGRQLHEVFVCIKQKVDLAQLVLW